MRGVRRQLTIIKYKCASSFVISKVECSVQQQQSISNEWKVSRFIRNEVQQWIIKCRFYFTIKTGRVNHNIFFLQIKTNVKSINYILLCTLINYHGAVLHWELLSFVTLKCNWINFKVQLRKQMHCYILLTLISNRFVISHMKKKCFVPNERSRTESNRIYGK